jgi:hypothetical protein
MSLLRAKSSTLSTASSGTRDVWRQTCGSFSLISEASLNIDRNQARSSTLRRKQKKLNNLLNLLNSELAFSSRSTNCPSTTILAKEELPRGRMTTVVGSRQFTAMDSAPRPRVVCIDGRALVLSRQQQTASGIMENGGRELVLLWKFIELRQCSTAILGLNS